MKTALIVGVSGQDGAYLSALLLEKGYRVVGTTRDPGQDNLWRLRRLGILGEIEVGTLNPADPAACAGLLNRIQPQEIYNLAAQSSVSRSFKYPLETYQSICPVTANLLEAIRQHNPTVRFYNAGSGEVFGESDRPFTENSPMRPRSPYGAAKLSAQLLVRSYREIFGLYACNGLQFNHESPLRGHCYVTRKIVDTASSIASGQNSKLRLGNIHIRRDWGWAPEYVEAMWLMLRQPVARDYVIATGVHHSLLEFVEVSFSTLGLDYRDHLLIDNSLLRPMDIAQSSGDSTLARDMLGWTPRHRMEDVARLMAEDAMVNALPESPRVQPIRINA